MITAIKLLFIFFILSNVSFYFHERSKWINSQHAHLKAKEYYVLNRMVFFYRKGLTKVVQVDNPIMYPLNKLQKALYNKGVSYLPQDDGESAVWKYHFFWQFYCKGYDLPNDGTPESIDNVSPLRIKTLDEIYSTLESLATKKISDPEIDSMRYKVLPITAELYALNHLYYYGNKSSPYRRNRFMIDRERYQRILNIVSWMETNYQNWKSKPDIYNEIRQKHQHIELSHYVSLLVYSELVLVKKIAFFDFSCNDHYASLFIKTRKQLLDFMSRKNLYVNKSQLELARKIAFNSNHNNTLAYLLVNNCRYSKDKAYPTEPEIRILHTKAGFQELRAKITSQLKVNNFKEE